jgi:hypothetical protein
MGASRPYDISGNLFPPDYASSSGGAGDASASLVTTIRPPRFEPPDGAREFIIGFSLIAAAGATTALFTLDANGNPNIPGAAIQLASGKIARISGILVSGDTGAASGSPLLTFFLSNSKDGTSRIPGLDAIPITADGGIVGEAFDVFTVIDNPGSFFGGFVVNADVAPRYASMLLQGWYW